MAANYGGLFRALGLMATSAAAGGQYSAGMYNYDAAKTDVSNVRLQATDAIFRGKVDQLDSKMKGDQTQGDLKADAAARGVEADSGSAADIQEGARQGAATDQARIEYNAFEEARMLRNKAAAMQEEAKREKKKTKVDAFSTFLGGVGKYYGSSN